MRSRIGSRRQTGAVLGVALLLLTTLTLLAVYASQFTRSRGMTLAAIQEREVALQSAEAALSAAERLTLATSTPESCTAQRCRIYPARMADAADFRSLSWWTEHGWAYTQTDHWVPADDADAAGYAAFVVEEIANVPDTLALVATGPAFGQKFYRITAFARSGVRGAPVVVQTTFSRRTNDTLATLAERIVTTDSQSACAAASQPIAAVDRAINELAEFKQADGTTLGADLELGTPAVVDSDADGIADVVYAGDAYGNLWKFAHTAASGHSWHAAWEGQPLFRARTDQGGLQTIRARPEVIKSADGTGAIVIFAAVPMTSGETTTLYAILDRGEPPTATRGSLAPVVTETNAASTREPRRTIARAAPGWSKDGWYFDLAPGSAERFVAAPIVRDGYVVFGTQAATGNCAALLTWTIALDALEPFAPRGATSDAPHEPILVGVSTIAPYQIDTQLVISQTRAAAGACALQIRGASGEALELRCRSTTGRHSWRQLR